MKNKWLLALLAVVTICFASAGLAACDDTPDNVTPPPGEEQENPGDDSGTAHTKHVWSGWTVEVAPEENKVGKAVRKCTAEGKCLAAASEKEYELPELTSEDYDPSEDTATCVDPGYIIYSYDKNDVEVEVKVDTEINPDAHDFYDMYLTDVYATCTAKGLESIHCSLCSFTKSPRELAVDPTAHNSVTHHDPKAAAGCVNGNKEFWSCSDCGNNFDDIECTNKLEKYGEIVWATDKHAGNAWDSTHSTAQVNPTCESDGYRAYYTCDTCDGKFTDSNYASYTSPLTMGNTVTAPNIPATEEELLMPAHGWKNSSGNWTRSNLTSVYGTPATCTSEGHTQAYYKCSTCNKYFGDRNLTEKISEADIKSYYLHALGHKEPEYFAEVAATCTTNGYVESWYCSRCDKYYTDAALTKDGSFSRKTTPMHPNAAKTTSPDKTITLAGGSTRTYRLIASNLLYCSDCEKYYYGTDKDFVVTAFHYDTTSSLNQGILVGLGDSKVAYTSNTTISFQAPADGTYTFTLSNPQNTPGTVLDSFAITNMWYCLDSNGIKVFYNSGNAALWLTSTNTAKAADARVAEKGKLANTLTVCMKKDELIGIKTNAKYFEVNVTKQATAFDELKIADATTQSLDVTPENDWSSAYRLYSDIAKTYKLMLPAGLSVALVSADYDPTKEGGLTVLCEGKPDAEGTAYVKLSAYKPVFLVFKHETAGTYTVNLSDGGADLGNKIIPGVPTEGVTISPREYESDGNGGFTTQLIEGSGMYTLEVGSIAAGKYTLTMELNPSTGRSTIYFGTNITGSWSDFFASNGNLQEGNSATVLLNQMNVKTYTDSITSTLDGWTWTITLDLKSDDKLVFVLGSTTACSISSITLTSAN